MSSQFRNLTAYSITDVYSQFVNKLRGYVEYLEKKTEIEFIRGERKPHPLILNFQTSDFPKYKNVILLIEQSELSVDKLKRIDRFLDYFKLSLERIDFGEESTWNFFDAAFGILMSDIERILAKPVLQVELFSHFSKPAQNLWSIRRTDDSYSEEGEKNSSRHIYNAA